MTKEQRIIREELERSGQPDKEEQERTIGKLMEQVNYEKKLNKTFRSFKKFPTENFSLLLISFHK